MRAHRGWIEQSIVAARPELRSDNMSSCSPGCATRCTREPMRASRSGTTAASTTLSNEPMKRIPTYDTTREQESLPTDKKDTL